MNMTIDWRIRKSEQAGMKRIIKRLLKKYDHPIEFSKEKTKKQKNKGSVCDMKTFW